MTGSLVALPVGVLAEDDAWGCGVDPERTGGVLSSSPAKRADENTEKT